MENTNKLAILTKDFNLPVISREIESIMQEEMDGMTITFDRVKIPSGGGLTFEIPGDDPDNPEVVKEIVGVIVDKHPVNAYWKEKYTGQNNPPDCSALDGKWGIGNPGGECKMCSLNQWGSALDDSGGKACKNMQRIYILREGEIFPLLLTLPPTSIQNFANYVKRIIAKGLRTYSVITKVVLKKATSKGGIIYSQASFQLAGKLPEEQVQKMRMYSEQIKAITRQINVFEDEYYNDNSAGTEIMADDEVAKIFAPSEEK